MTTKNTRETLDFLDTLIDEPLTFADLLKAIRESEEETQAQFAQRLLITRHYLSDIENGRRLVAPKMAAKYAAILGYPTEQFLRLALDDMLTRDGLHFHVDLHHAA